MDKYTIEGNFNFYDELYKSLDDIETDINTNDDTTDNIQKLCLITNSPLTDNHFKMDCGHKFNYIPLYKDLLNHKNKFNIMESSSTKLKKNEIRCPYCRNKQNKLLPFLDIKGVQQIYGVNQLYPENPIKNRCCYYKDHTNETNMGCSTIVSELFGKSYCYYHKKQMISQYKEEEKKKVLLQKEEANKLKEKLKLEKIENDKNIKDYKNNNNDNIVITPTICNEIIKTGVRKGKYCCAKVHSNNLCKRHYNNKNKSNANELHINQTIITTL